MIDSPLRSEVVTPPLPPYVPPTFLDKTLASLGIELSDLQDAPYRSTARVIQMTGGWRAGKSFLSALWQWARIMTGPLHWITGPDYWQAKAEYNYIIQFAKQRGVWESSTNKDRDSNTITLKLKYPLWDPHGEPIKIETKSSVYPEKLGAVAPSTILMIEAGQQSSEVRKILIGRTSEKRAPVLMSGTIEKDTGWFADFYEQNLNGLVQAEHFTPGAQVHKLPSWANLHVFPGGREDPEILYQAAVLGADLFNEKFGAIPGKRRHLVFSDYNPKLHRGVPWWGRRVNPDMPVMLGIDPAVNHRHAIGAFQRDKNDIWLVDTVWLRGLTGQGVINEAKKRSWWKQINYWVMDASGSQRHGVASYRDIYAQNLPGVPFNMNRVPLLAGYNRHKECLLAAPGDPRLILLDDSKAVGALEWEYSKHQYVTDKVGDALREEPKPIHDDMIKATTYLLWDLFRATGSRYSPVRTKLRLS